jgi:hypothetical protein
MKKKFEGRDLIARALKKAEPRRTPKPGEELEWKINARHVFINEIMRGLLENAHAQIIHEALEYYFWSHINEVYAKAEAEQAAADKLRIEQAADGYLELMSNLRALAPGELNRKAKELFRYFTDDGIKAVIDLALQRKREAKEQERTLTESGIAPRSSMGGVMERGRAA